MFDVTYMIEHSNTVRRAQIDKYPDYCPHCDMGISPSFRYGFMHGQIIQLVFNCPMSNCKRLFISDYGSSLKNEFYLYMSTHIPNELKKLTFDERIQFLSPNFAKIFQEAFYAEQMGLVEICGMAYRKSIEFLVKDYLIFRSPENEEIIIRKPLGSCIDQDIDNPKIKNMAKRAVWLGNDETHYSRKHETMGVADLKMLIDVTQHWIMLELISDEYEAKITK